VVLLRPLLPDTSMTCGDLGPGGALLADWSVATAEQFGVYSQGDSW
jgi:hypothetical protein